MEPTNGLPILENRKLLLISPREFLMRNLKYLPWLVISLAIALIIAKVKLRYATPIYQTEARLLIKKETPYSRSNEKFDEIFTGGQTQNVYNEIEILKSRPLAAKVAKVLKLQATCFNKGNIRSTLLYRDAPMAIVPVLPSDSALEVSTQITVTDNEHFKLNEETKTHSFGEALNQNHVQFAIIKLLPQVYNANASNVYLLGRHSLSSAAETVVGGSGVVLADNSSQIVNLRFESENTDLAVDILNTLMAVYKESNIEDKRQMRISTLEFIDERLDSLRGELGLVEQHLTEFIEAKKAFRLEKQSEIYLDRLNSETTNLAQQDLKISII